MSNWIRCPACEVETSDATFPCVGWGYFVTSHQTDGTSGSEDPAEVIQSGVKTYMCPCQAAIWVVDVGWLTLPDLDPQKHQLLAEQRATPRRMIRLREMVARSTRSDNEDFVTCPNTRTVLGRPIQETLFVTLGSARATLGLRRRRGGTGCDLRAIQTERGARVECLSCAVEVGPETADVSDRISRHLSEGRTTTDPE